MVSAYGAHLQTQAMEDSTPTTNVVPSTFIRQMPYLSRQKTILRKTMLHKRAMARRDNPDAATALRDQFLANIQRPPQSLIACYCAIKDEMDCIPLILALAEKGHSLCLPVIVQKNTPLVFRAWAIGDDLILNRWGIAEPAHNKPELLPDVLLIPLLAFDRQGNRLGYGGGYYDRSLLALRKQKKIMAIGIGYAAQELDNVPAGVHDEKLDAVVTERFSILFSQQVCN